MNQHFNSVQFFKCNDLVTENCLFVSFIDFRLSKLYHYITKIHFPVHNSKSYFLFYAFYIVLYTLLKTATVRCTEADFRKDTSKEMSTMTTMSQMTQPSSWTYLFILLYHYVYCVRSSIRSKYISRVCMGCMTDCSSAVLLPCRKVHSSFSVENRNLKPFR